MDNDACYLCGSKKFDEIRLIDGKTSIVKCKECSMTRTYPYPTFSFTCQEKYSKFYLDNEAMFRMFARAMMDEIKIYKTTGSFFDIGCAVGYLLDEARNAGFAKTSGIELNLDAAEISRKKGHAIHTQPLAEINMDKEKFDVISFNHLIEHILDIKSFLADIKRILAKDGIIYCGMPNYNSLMQKWLKKNWYGWGMPDHVWHFELSTFRAVMTEAGFRPIKIVQNAMYYPYSKSLRKNTRATIARIAGRLGLGDQIYGVFASG